MARSLPEMSQWDAVFDETYLQILDCPTGFGRHAPEAWRLILRVR